MVACDGTSTGQNSDLAAQAACDRAQAVIEEAVIAESDLREAAGKAASEAHAAVLALPYNKEEAAKNSVFLPADKRDPKARTSPACTFTLVIVDGTKLIHANVGDSRAYFIGSTVKKQLTVDDSWAEQMVQSGKLTMEEALAEENGHAVIEWLGPENDPAARVDAFEIAEAGCVLAVSDGLWNYADSPDAVAAQVSACDKEAEPIEIARHLVEFAKSAGGHDNITVVVVPVAAS